MVDGTLENLRELALSSGAVLNSDSTSDAELLRDLFAQFGDAVFERLLGSFALAIVTRSSGEVVLTRDRFGDKPLFYVRTRAGWAWASEIKSLCPLLDSAALDSEGLRQAIQYRYVLGDTLINGVSQVMPACLVRLPARGSPVEKQYWKLDLHVEEAGNLESWADRTDTGLDACFQRLRRRYRDVAILLSGGVDSSLIALKAARSGFRTCVALTARWPGENPELESAVTVARHIGIEHRIIDIDDSQIAESLPWLVWRLEEPPRHYNSFVLARLFEAASGRFDTLLSGHAADVLFGPPGIISLEVFRRRVSLLAFLPRGLKKALGAALGRSNRTRLGKLRKYLELDEHELTQRYFAIRYRHGLDRRQVALGPSRRSVERFYDPGESATERFQRFDLYTFNQSHTQVYDRLGAPMGVNVTTPFLSPEIVQVAESLPSRLKSDGHIAKPVLKTLAARYFPREWIYRPNQGFPTPASRWIEGPLDDWRRALLDERMAMRGVVELAKSANGDDFEAVWTAMTLEMFCRQFLDGEEGPAHMNASRVPITD